MIPLLLNEASLTLLELVAEATQKFAAMDEAAWQYRSAAGKWCRKEVLGHLVDSAACNHQRFLRAQLEEEIYSGPGYPQDDFVRLQQYATADTATLVALWRAFNIHLAHVVRNIDPGKLDVACSIGNNAPVTLSFVVTDYVAHLHHHLEALFTEHT
ncbi:MAG: DinB family protein [Flavipsychrobacter sp.]|nr:DinB family protein [Flavipsychrobacter sp.]